VKKKKDQIPVGVPFADFFSRNDISRQHRRRDDEKTPMKSGQLVDYAARVKGLFFVGGGVGAVKTISALPPRAGQGIQPQNLEITGKKPQ